MSNVANTNCCVQRRWRLSLPSFGGIVLSAVLTIVFAPLFNMHRVTNSILEKVKLSTSITRAVTDSAATNEVINIVNSDSIQAPRNQSSCASFQVPKKAIKKDCLMSYLVTFPGSGSELCLELIEGLTGIKTARGYPMLVKNATRKAVVVKTHFPNPRVAGGVPRKNRVRVLRAILLLRNPMHAIPSYFNFRFEEDWQRPDHSQQAPIEEWIEWRDNEFSTMLNAWATHMTYWLAQHHLLAASSLQKPHHDTMRNDTQRGNKTMIMVCYEHMIDPVKGPTLMKAMGDFLEQNENVSVTIAPAQLPCLWDYVVNQRKAKKRNDTSRYTPPYTNEQLVEMIQMLQHQYTRYETEYPQLMAILQDYKMMVEDRLRKQQNAL